MTRIFMVAHAESTKGPKGASTPVTLTPSQQKRYQQLLKTRGGVAAVDYLERVRQRANSAG